VTRQLKFARRAAKSGRATSLVVFVHGYGADGADLLGLADVMAQALPDTVFVAPDAPEACAGNPFGRQWFPIPWLDGSSPVAAAVGLAAAADDLGAFLDARLADEGLAAGALALVGFSQGAMLALHVAVRRAVAVAAVVSYSGRLLVPGARAAGGRGARPPAGAAGAWRRRPDGAVRGYGHRGGCAGAGGVFGRGPCDARGGARHCA